MQETNINRLLHLHIEDSNLKKEDVLKPPIFAQNYYLRYFKAFLVCFVFLKK